MGSLAEIELAVGDLSPEEQRALLEWLERRLPPAAENPSSGDDAVKAFRELQRQASLTPAAAEMWKAAVSDARR